MNLNLFSVGLLAAGSILIYSAAVDKSPREVVESILNKQSPAIIKTKTDEKSVDLLGEFNKATGNSSDAKKKKFDSRNYR